MNINVKKKISLKEEVNSNTSYNMDETSYTKWNKPHTPTFFIYSCLIKVKGTFKIMRSLSGMAIREPKETKYIQTKEMTQEARCHPEFFYCFKIIKIIIIFISKILLSLQVSTDF